MSTKRRGISLMEVLISMFVLAVGLLGVAALIPAGRHQIVEATKLEAAAMVGRNAFRDLQVRNYLKPIEWSRFPDRVAPVYNPQDPEPFTIRGGVSKKLAYVLDPLARTASAGDYGLNFPAGTGTSNPPFLSRIVPKPGLTTDKAALRGFYDTVFRSSFDLSTEKNSANSDLPPAQRFFENAGTKLRRESFGNYSWVATITSDPSRDAIVGDASVAVAVFYKRNLSEKGAGEHIANMKRLVVPMTSGGEAVIENLPVVDGKPRPLKPGQWIMLAGWKMTIPPPPPPGGPAIQPQKWNYYQWYRVLSAAPIDASAGYEQAVTLAGQDWTCVAGNTQVWILDNVVSVYEKSLPLDLN